MTSAIIYLRFSTPRQERGSSKERQLENCRAFIERMGWREVEVVADFGVSAWKGDHLRRGNLGKLRGRLDAGEFPPGTVIVVEEIDRLGRQKARLTKRWIEDVCEAGFSVATAASAKVYDEANLDANILSIMEILLKAEAAHEYSERLSRRAKGSYVERLKQARIDHTPITKQGPAFIKWSDEEGLWEPVPDRMRVVFEILELARAGQAAWDVAKCFNDRSEKSFTGKAWERTAIVNIIRNRALEGDYVVGEGKNSRPTGEVIAGYYGEPFVPLDLLAEAAFLGAVQRVFEGYFLN